MTATTEPKASLWTGAYGPATAGIFAFAFMIAFETIGVLTVMPVVADDLDALSWFGVAFAAPMATGVVGLTLSGSWSDRAGPMPPMLTGAVLFSAGLIVCGTATSIQVFLLGRAVQGFGGGLLGVSLYVLIGRAFPDHLRARAFAVLTSAWTIPALVGPPLAGWVSHAVGWRWIFLAVPIVVMATMTVLLPSLRSTSGRGEAPAPRTLSAIAVAIGVLGLTVAGQREVPGWPVLAIGSLVVIGLVGPSLLLPGTWTARPGLPSAILTRGLMAAGFFGAEAYFPLSLVENRGLSTTASGMALTGAGLLWFVGAWSSANLSYFASRRLRLRLGISGVVIGALAVLATVIPVVPVWVLIAAWSVGGFGMGMATSTIALLVIELSAPGEQGANSAALQINDQLTQAVVLALGSIVFAWLIVSNSTAAFASVVGGAAVMVVVGLWTQSRIRIA